MNHTERRQHDRRRAAIAGWQELGRQAERRKAIRRATLSARQADWYDRYVAAKAA